MHQFFVQNQLSATLQAITEFLDERFITDRKNVYTLSNNVGVLNDHIVTRFKELAILTCEKRFIENCMDFQFEFLYHDGWAVIRPSPALAQLAAIMGVEVRAYLFNFDDHYA